MRFNSDGKIKIMQITDIQEIPDVSPDTIKLINAALEEEKPDLVVLTGDQIKGYGVSYKGKGEALIESVAETVGKLLKPVTDRHIPFAVTFGNHDRQVGISNKDQFEKIYKALPGCVGEQVEGIDGGGTYNIPILSSDGERTAFNLYLFDSGTDAKGGGYEPFDPEIIDWYKKKRDELKAQNGDYIPSLVFQHIPMFEHYNVLKRVGKREKGAIPAFRIHKGEHYKNRRNQVRRGFCIIRASVDTGHQHRRVRSAKRKRRCARRICRSRPQKLLCRKSRQYRCRFHSVGGLQCLRQRKTARRALLRPRRERSAQL